MLGNMKTLRSTAELKTLLDVPDLLVKTYVWQALLRLKDYSVLPAVAEFFVAQPEAPRELFLPRDRLFAMQDELVGEVGTIRSFGCTAIPREVCRIGQAVPAYGSSATDRICAQRLCSPQGTG